MVEIFKNDTPETATSFGTLAFSTNLPSDVIAKTNVFEFDSVNASTGSGDEVDYYTFTPYQLASVRIEFNATSTGSYANWLFIDPISGVSSISGDTAGAWYSTSSTGGLYGDSGVFSQSVVQTAQALQNLSSTTGSPDINQLDNEAIWTLTGDPVTFSVTGYEFRGTTFEQAAAVSSVGFTLEIFPYTGLIPTSGDSSVGFSSLGSETDRGDGFDQITFGGDNVSSHTLTSLNMAGNTITVDGTTLSNVERLVFNDWTFALDDEGAAGQTYRLYQAAFARTPDYAGLGHNTRLVDGGLTLKDMANAFINSAEFIQTYGANTSDTTFVTLFYNNVLGRAPDDAGLSGWLDRLSSGSYDRADVLIGFSESAENQTLVGQTTDVNGIWFT
jgi:hypothetical protein